MLAKTAVSHLTCEYQTNPLGLAVRQTAYQILAAASINQQDLL